MNKNRRKQIQSAVSKLQDGLSYLESIKDDEDEARENIPESFQSGDRYTASEECSDVLEDAINAISEVIENIGNL